MAFTQEYFTQPIPVPCTLTKTVIDEEGNIITTEEKLLFTLKRETQQEATQSAQAEILYAFSSRELRLTRFAGLLTTEPTGFADFPRDERPLVERAIAYFTPEGFDVLIKSVMLFYDKAAYPSELFRGL